MVEARRAISAPEAYGGPGNSCAKDGTTGMSVWWRDHADHHMSVLRSTDGLVKACTPDDGHRTKLTPLPCEETPAGLFENRGMSAKLEVTMVGVNPGYPRLGNREPPGSSLTRSSSG
ncbi:DUF4913 domain-containing protein [Arthrobacter sp. NPDC058097]|uniref:DUF4913 domain-containing protein n=1 Tax=Arthrobacter sp. NPDC058097 TaxID=3346340 RepID=UPI0036DE2145